MSDYLDCLQQEITSGCYIAGTISNDGVPQIYEVIGFTPKMVRARPLGQLQDDATLKKPFAVIVLDEKLVHAMLNRPVTDLVGQELKVGDTVYGNDGDYIDPIIFEITDIYEDKVKVKPIMGRNRYTRKTIRYGHDFVKIAPELVSYAIIKES